MRRQDFALLVALIVAVGMTACSVTKRKTVYWPAGAIFSERGDSVYFVVRKTDVTELGPLTATHRPAGLYPLCEGGSIFEPPHYVTVWSDELSLRRIRLTDGLTEELIHWPRTPRTGARGEHSYYGFCYPAAAVMDWDGSHKLRVAISLVESSQGTQALWSEGERGEATAFRYENPPTPPGHLNVGGVHGNLEVIPLLGDDFVAAFVLYNWAVPEARVIVIQPPGAEFRTAELGSTLRAATLLSQHVQAENARLLPILSERFQKEGAAKGLDGYSYAVDRIGGLPQYVLGGHEHIRELTQEQIEMLKRGQAFEPLLDLNNPNLVDNLKPEVLEMIERLPSTDSDLAGNSLSDLYTLARPAASNVMYVRRGDRTLEIRWY